MDRREPVLLPRPRRLDLGRGWVAVGPVATTRVRDLPPEGYRIRIGAEGVFVEAADAAGQAHARRTLDQLTDDRGRWPEAEVEDWPDVAIRGVMLDVSRDKVPTMETLEAIVDQLAAWKVNHLELYVEHTFAHPGLEEVWAAASPFTAAEIERLDRFCRDRFIDLVPQQNTLGHMERYLIHPRFRGMALEPDGFTWLGFMRRPAATLDPRRDDAFELASQLVDDWCDVLPRAATVHVGLDEPWEMGEELLPDYLRWMERLRLLPSLDGRMMAIHGDVLASHPELIGAVPAGVTVTEWGYEADHPWAERLGRLSDAGIPRWVLCGTSAWSSLLGRTSNMVSNIGGAVDAALSDGGVDAVVTTDWGDWGHLQPVPVSWPGFAWGAAQTWCRTANRDLDLAAALDANCVESTGAGWGATLMALGDAHQQWGAPVPNIASCFLNLWMNQLRVRGVTRDAPAAVRAAIDDALTLGDPGPEVTATVDLARALLDDDDARLAGDGTVGSIPAPARGALDAAIGEVIDRHRELWLRRHRPGGLDDSVAWLENLRSAYRSGETNREWSGPLQSL